MVPNPYHQVILFGDSLIQHCTDNLDGFVFHSAVQAHCNRRLDVINRGFSGYNTSQCLRILQDVIPSTSCTKIDYFVNPTCPAIYFNNPKLISKLILLGSNDACLPGTTGQTVNLPQYKANLEAIISFPPLRAHNPTILLCTPPPIDEIHITELDLACGWESGTRTSENTATYAQVVRDIASAADEKVVLVDLFASLMENAISMTPDWKAEHGILGSVKSGMRGWLEKLLPDGLHMSGEAYKVFSKLVVEEIGREWRDEKKAGENYEPPSWVFPSYWKATWADPSH
ncbi:SGNH hydrolase [Mollisia scopiformis]|uniref:SGNH hydrolase n=1 Tax=Mollisia scopiformis TaxID=149040 RepID=A0A194XUF4_MOLSC|nr:SGNH hydrolase [Mollisia scopiformis]KUJ23843.1 SGNH hydrolase [Mollisia scopiformis]